LDVASLIKQFFRELPDPLFTSRLHDTFLKCFSLETEDARITAILLLCHQLPWHHLSTLRYMMLFLQKVAHNCDLNKMDIANLAVCVTPNLMHNNISEKKSDKMTESKWLQIQTNIVQLLILYAGDIGMVPDSLYERSVLMSACFPTDDDLERSEVIQEDGQHKNNTKKKKKRSGSLQGWLYSYYYNTRFILYPFNTVFSGTLQLYAHTQTNTHTHTHTHGENWAPPWSSSSVLVKPHITITCVPIMAWADLKVVSSLTLLHYLRKSLDPFSLPCVRKWQ